MSLSVDEQQTSDTTFQVKVSGVSYFASFSSTGTWVDSVAGLAALCILHSRILLVLHQLWLSEVQGHFGPCSPDSVEVLSIRLPILSGNRLVTEN